MENLSVLTDNSNGCTVDQNLNLVQKAKGYFVALTDNRVIETIESELQKLRSMAEMLKLSNAYFGYWVDEKTGAAYLDLSVHVGNKKTAV